MYSPDDLDFDPIETAIKKKIKLTSEKSNQGKKKFFNIGAALAVNPRTKKPIKLATISIQRSNSD